MHELRELISSDFARIENSGGVHRAVLFVFRLGQYVHDRGRRGPLFLIWRLADVLFLRLLLGTELPPSVQVGPGLAIPHAARGLVLHRNVVIGSGATILHRVTIGTREGDLGVPVLGDDICVGTGACILGGVRIGDGARIGANAVVLHDVPGGAAAGGVPARVLGSQA